MKWSEGSKGKEVIGNSERKGRGKGGNEMKGKEVKGYDMWARQESKGKK